MDNSVKRPDPGEFFAGQEMDELLHFYGVVKDKDAAAVEGAAVIVFACFDGGTEKLLGSTFTDSEGMYLINIPKLPDYNGLLGFKIRAGKAYILPEGEIFDDKTVGVPTKHHIDVPVIESETDEIFDISDTSRENAATLPEAPVELTDKGVEVSQSNQKEDGPPQKTPYDMYRSTYWHWLRR